MNYIKKEIKSGITIHLINTNKFKTNLITVILTTPLSKETITLNSLISLILRRGSKNMQSEEKISIALENMYGATFDCGIEKIGDNHIIKFFLESLNDEYIPNGESILNSSIDKILEIVFNPYIVEEKFDEKYFELEKNNLEQLIKSKIDNKAKYALDRCIEEMYKAKPYGLYKYGYVEDLINITSKDLYEYYKKLISECKIDIFISGKMQQETIEKIMDNENIVKLSKRIPNYISDEIETNTPYKNVNIVEESMDISQGKLVIGLDINNSDLDSKNIALVYNAILGGTANSKLFQNVREKSHLAYTSSSNYLRQKNNIFIRCGIEIKNYEKAIKIINEQIDEMKSGNFTEKDLENAKKNIISTIRQIPEEQYTQITYYLGQELSGNNVEIQQYIENINKITKNEIQNLANQITTNTVYFLKN